LLRDFAQNTTISLPNILENFDDLRLIIHSRTKRVSHYIGFPILFHIVTLHRLMPYMFFILCSGIATFAYFDSQYGAFVGFLIFGVLGLILLFTEMVGVIINNDSLILKYHLRKSLIPFSFIENIIIHNGAKSYSEIKIALHNGKVIKLGGFKEGTFCLYETLLPLLKQYKQQLPKTGN
jgi:hypothetical protein